jgi:hypothetical protein
MAVDRPWGRNAIIIALTGWGKKQAEQIACATDFDGGFSSLLNSVS